MTRFLTLATMILLTSPALAQTNPTGSWELRASHVYWNGGGSAGSDAHFYVLSGNSFRRYDPAADTWTTLANAPQAVTYTTCSYANGCVYAFGGVGTGVIMKYTIATSTWNVPVATVPVNSNASSATLGTRIYVSGGSPSTTAFTEFDTVTEGTRALAPLPVAMQFHASAGFEDNGKVYVNNGGMYEYDPAQNTWAAKTAIPNRLRHRAFVLNRRIYITGGQLGITRTAETQEYNPMSDSWVRRADLVEGRYLHAAAAVNGKGYIYGGYWASSYATTEEFTPPNFGAPPNPAANVRQFNIKGDVAQGDWTGTEIKFAADISDPDATDTVSFDVQIKPVATASWNGLPVLSTGLQPQGPVTFTALITTGGHYDWRYRVADVKGNIAGTWVEYRNNTLSPDFKSDQTVPSTVSGISPISEVTTLHGDSHGGNQLFTWNAATDNGGTAGMTYDVEVSADAFQSLEASAAGVSGTSTQFRLAASVRSLTAKQWRVRAIDAIGNVGAWSPVYVFQVALDDQIDHGAGDAAKCGLSVTGGANLVWLLVGLVFFLRRR